MVTLQTTPLLPPTSEAIAQAADLLKAGHLVAMPTETVYGLAGDAGNDHAIAAIFAAKQRPSFNPLILHLSSAGQAESLVTLSPQAQDLMAAFWPGALTLVLPKKKTAAVSLLASAGLESLALRQPAHPIAQALIAAVGRPLAAPSANPSGHISPSCAAHVKEGLDGRLAAILDGGACAIGVESTVVSLLTETPTLLRPGGVPKEALEAVLGRPVALSTHMAQGASEAQKDFAPASPGLLSRHYAPDHCPVRLKSCLPEKEGEVLLAFGPEPDLSASALRFAACENLSPTGDLEEAAAHLFAALRRFDRPDVTAIVVMPIPDHGLGAAINDRLKRAATP